MGAVCSIEESSGPQNLRVQKVMSQRSSDSCTRDNALPDMGMKNVKSGHVLSFYMHKKVFHKKIRIILGISKAIMVFDSPLLFV